MSMFRTEYNANQVHSSSTRVCAFRSRKEKELNLDAEAFKSVAVIQIIDSLMLKAQYNHIPDPESRLKEMTQGFERK